MEECSIQPSVSSRGTWVIQLTPAIAVRKILIVTANPQDTSSLALARELKCVLEAVQKGKQRDSFDILDYPAASPDSLRFSLLDKEPQIDESPL